MTRIILSFIDSTTHHALSPLSLKLWWYDISTLYTSHSHLVIRIKCLVKKYSTDNLKLKQDHIMGANIYPRYKHLQLAVCDTVAHLNMKLDCIWVLLIMLGLDLEFSTCKTTWLLITILIILHWLVILSNT